MPATCVRAIVLPLLLVICLAGCTSLDPVTAEEYMDDYVQPRKFVELHEFSPLETSRGALVTITGKNFSSDPALNRVIFPPNEYAPVLEASPTRLVVSTPPKATSGKIIVQSGLHSAVFTTSCTVIPGGNGDRTPTIIPSKIRPGITVGITGSGFSTTLEKNIVYLGSRRAKVTAATPTRLTIVVPDSVQPDYVVVCYPFYTAISDNQYTVYKPGDPLEPGFCRMTLENLQVEYYDHLLCNDYCKENMSRYGIMPSLLTANLSRKSDTVWMAGASHLIFDQQALTIRKGSLVVTGHTKMYPCTIEHEFRLELRTPLSVTAMPEEGHFKVVLSGAQLQEIAGEPIVTGQGDYHDRRCMCECWRDLTSYKFFPETTLTIEFWH